jgi:nucleotide-binding universal stress UspA family protein
MYERILVAVDGSPSSDLAIAQAAGLAKGMGAEVKVLFVVDEGEVFLEAGFVNPQDILNGLTDFGRKALQPPLTVSRTLACGFKPNWQRSRWCRVTSPARSSAMPTAGQPM